MSLDIISTDHRFSIEVLNYIKTTSDFPHGRYMMRQRFYSKFGFSKSNDLGFGKSELDFLNWVIKRSVLNPVHFSLKPGSLWWRKIHDSYMFYSELSGKLFENNDNSLLEYSTVLMWFNYFKDPNEISWYRAHNTSIIQSYIDAIPEAFHENQTERLLMNIVLYRVLYAQSMIEGNTLFGELGALLASPKNDSVKAIVSLPDFYPDNYPLTEDDRKFLMGEKSGIGDDIVKIFDNSFILPWIKSIYEFGAEKNRLPFLNKFLKGKSPIYPHTNEESLNGK